MDSESEHTQLPPQAPPIQPNAEPAPPAPPTFDELNQKDELTQQELQTALNTYAEAIRTEFEDSLKEQDELENVPKYTQDFFKRNVAAAAAQIVWLGNNADSETVKLSASKYVVDKALEDATKDGDPIRDLLKELGATATPNPTTTPTAQATTAKPKLAKSNQSMARDTT